MAVGDVDIEEIFHNNGYRLTIQRQMVLDTVRSAGRHITPEEIYQRVHEKSAAVNRATVYRVLKLLRELDLIASLVHPNGRVEYQIAAEPGHLHFLCRGCGTNNEFSNEALVAFAETLRLQFGLRLEMSHLTLTGLCADCH